jgi:hypothetical protein
VPALTPQLEASFTAHWPPAMSLAQFMALCKDSETTDTSAGARIRWATVAGVWLRGSRAWCSSGQASGTPQWDSHALGTSTGGNKLLSGAMLQHPPRLTPAASPAQRSALTPPLLTAPRTPRSNAAARMLAPRELERVFDAYATCHAAAAGSTAAACGAASEATLGYEQFLAAVVHVGLLLRAAPNLPLSECAR